MLHILKLGIHKDDIGKVTTNKWRVMKICKDFTHPWRGLRRVRQNKKIFHQYPSADGHWRL